MLFRSVPMEMKELLGFLNGPPARELGDNACQFVSDVQHEFWRLYGVYARPYWALQGDRGGHQVKLSPWQTNIALAKGLPPDPPAIGSLPFAPFDQRTVKQLQHFNRLHQLDDRLDRLQASGSKAAADAEMEAIQKEIRLAETSFIESQFEPVVDMAQSLVRGQNSRSEYDDQIIRVNPGDAARAADAYDKYLATGDFDRINFGK